LSIFNNRENKRLQEVKVISSENMTALHIKKVCEALMGEWLGVK
jgi:hypothetical protein